MVLRVDIPRHHQVLRIFNNHLFQSIYNLVTNPNQYLEQEGLDALLKEKLLERLLARRHLAIQSDFYHFQLQNLLETHRLTRSRHA